MGCGLKEDPRYAEGSDLVFGFFTDIKLDSSGIYTKVNFYLSYLFRKSI